MTAQEMQEKLKTETIMVAPIDGSDYLLVFEGKRIGEKAICFVDKSKWTIHEIGNSFVLEEK